MELLKTDFGPKLVYLLGITNIISVFLVFFTCRCLMGPRLGKFLNSFSWYPKLFRMHCYFWWIFATSVIIHATLAIIVFGNPFIK